MVRPGCRGGGGAERSSSHLRYGSGRGRRQRRPSGRTSTGALPEIPVPVPFRVTGLAWPDTPSLSPTAVACFTIRTFIDVSGRSAYRPLVPHARVDPSWPRDHRIRSNLVTVLTRPTDAARVTVAEGYSDFRASAVFRICPNVVRRVRRCLFANRARASYAASRGSVKHFCEEDSPRKLP